MEDQQGGGVEHFRPNFSSGDESSDMGVPMEAEVEAEATVPHLCQQCGKQFGSGKALGGHKRIHNQAAKRDLRRKKKTQKLNPLEGSDEEFHNCPVCAKDFASAKALYGHLRLHPERTWRGKQPLLPPSNSSSNPSPSPSDPPINPIASCSFPNSPRFASSWSSNNADEEETANTLLLLSYGGGSSSSGPNERVIDDNHEKINVIQSEEPISRTMIELEEKSKLGFTVSKEEEIKVYVCHSCNSSFTTHQAYGGHMSSHNKAAATATTTTATTIRTKINPPTLDSISTSRCITSGKSDFVVGRHRVALDIDLNELPPQEEEEACPWLKS